MSRAPADEFWSSLRILLLGGLIPFLVVLLCVLLAYVIPFVISIVFIALMVYPIRLHIKNGLCFTIRWIFAFDFVPDTDLRNAKTGISELVTIFIFGVTQGGVLMLSERKAIEVRIVPIMFYVSSSILTFGLAIGVLRARAKDAMDKTHLFNSGTIRFGRCTLFAMFIVFAGIVAAAFSNWFPKDPERVELEIKNVDKHNFQYDDKVLGITFGTTIGENEFRKMGFPTNPALSIAVDSDLYAQWYVSAVEGFSVEETTDEKTKVNRRPMKTAPVMVEFSKHTTGKSRICAVQFHNLNPTEKYELKLYLHPREGNPALSSNAVTRDKTLNSLKENLKLLRLIMHPPEQLK